VLSDSPLLASVHTERVAIMGGSKHGPKELDRRWDEMFGQLEIFRRENGDCLVPQGWTKAPNLARWVNSQRERQRQGNMPEDRKEKLDGLGFWWGTSNEVREVSSFPVLLMSCARLTSHQLA